MRESDSQSAITAAGVVSLIHSATICRPMDSPPLATTPAMTRRVPASPCRAEMPAVVRSSRRWRRRRSACRRGRAPLCPGSAVRQDGRRAASPARRDQAEAGGSPATQTRRPHCHRRRGHRRSPSATISDGESSAALARKTPASRPKHRDQHSAPAGGRGGRRSHRCRRPTPARDRPPRARPTRRSLAPRRH